VGEVKPVGNGVYQVDVDGKTEMLYAVGPAHDRWVFWNGRVFRGDFRKDASAARGSHGSTAPRTLTAPMPATIVTVHVKAGDAVTKGQVLMLLEAMKMELPIRAPGDGVVSAVHGTGGELVQADTKLVEFQ
jgi:3-methylcrotonyl-CoA carboxylase alpha subunit